MPKPISVKNFTEITKALQGIAKELQNISSKSVEKVDDEFKKAKKNVESLKEEVKDLNDELDEMAKEGGITAAFKLDKMKAVGKEIDNLALKLEGCTDLRQIRKYEKELDVLKNKFGEAKKAEPFKYFSDMLKKTHAPLKGFSNNLGNTADGVSAIGNKIGTLPGLLGKAGTAVKGLGAGIGGVSKLLGGPAGMVAMVAWQAVKAVVKIDSYIKGLNKKFAAIRGPQIMTPDIAQQFKKFNDAVFDIGRNIAEGLQPEEVYDFMASVTLAGKSLATLDNGFYTYRDTVHIAAQASKVFGMDVSKVGDMMGKFSVDYKMNLEDIDHAFKNVAFDAEKSGLSTDRFWNAVENASASLAFYGRFMESASRTMKKFTETGIMGADQAAEATKDITQLMKGVSTPQRMGWLRIAGKDAQKFVSDAFDALRAEAEKRVQEITARIGELRLEKEKKPEEAGQIDKMINDLNTQLEAQRKEMIENGKAVGMGTRALVQQAYLLPKLSGKTNQLVAQLITGILRGRDFSQIQDKQALKALYGIQAMLGMNEETFRAFVATVQVTGQSLENRTSNMLNGLLKKGDAAETNSEEIIKNLSQLNQHSDPKKIEDVANKIVELTGVTYDEAKVVAQGAASNEDFNKGLQKLTKDTVVNKYDTKMINKRMKDLVKDTLASKSLFSIQTDQQEAGQNEIASNYDKTFNEIRGQTLSFEDMRDITQKGINYNLAMLSGVSSISKWANKIYDILREKFFKGEKTKAEKEATAAFTGLKKILGLQNFSTEEAVFYAHQNIKKQQELININKEKMKKPGANIEQLKAQNKAAQKIIDQNTEMIGQAKEGQELDENVDGYLSQLAGTGDDALTIQEQYRKDLIAQFGETPTIKNLMGNDMGKAYLAFMRATGKIKAPGGWENREELVNLKSGGAFPLTPAGTPSPFQLAPASAGPPGTAKMPVVIGQPTSKSPLIASQLGGGTSPAAGNVVVNINGINMNTQELENTVRKVIHKGKIK